MDTLTLSGLQYHAYHGVYEKERTKGNDFEVDLIFYGDLRSTALDDDLSQTIDYEKAEHIVRGVMEAPSVQLLETLVCTIGNKLFDEFSRAEQLEVCVRKLQPPLNTKTNYSEVKCSWTR